MRLAALWWRVVRWWDERLGVFCRLCTVELDEEDQRIDALRNASHCRECSRVLARFEADRVWAARMEHQQGEEKAP